MTFVDSLLQTGLLGLTRNSLMIPTSMEMIRWDPRRFEEKDKILNVAFDKNLNIAVADGFEALGLKVSRINRSNDPNVILERLELNSNDSVMVFKQSNELKRYLDSCEILAKIIKSGQDCGENSKVAHFYNSFFNNEVTKRKSNEYDFLKILNLVYQEKVSKRNEFLDIGKIVSAYIIL